MYSIPLSSSKSPSAPESSGQNKQKKREILQMEKTGPPDLFFQRILANEIPYPIDNSVLKKVSVTLYVNDR